MFYVRWRTATLKQIKQAYRELANKISERRQTSAANLAEQITVQMQSLGMQGGSLQIEVIKDKDKVSVHGMDEIEFMVSTNTGLPPKPLAKTASGGELSRISLAIQVIAAQSKQAPTLVFDEVDVGVGGAIGQTVGEKLRELGQLAQIICITHLAQVAARGHQHLLVNKVQGQQTTSTQIKPLDRQGRIDEIARMIGGSQITDKTIDHAQEMLSQVKN